jgi:hypothetical protein
MKRDRGVEKNGRNKETDRECVGRKLKHDDDDDDDGT